MRSLLATSILTLAAVFSFNIASSSHVSAVSYGEGPYGVCGYQEDCPTAGAASNAAAQNSSSPNTGLEKKSMLIAIIAAIIGLALLTSAGIRYKNRVKKNTSRQA